MEEVKKNVLKSAPTKKIFDKPITGAGISFYMLFILF